MRERIGYLHVPKTAGSSVTEALVRAATDASGHDGRPIAVCPAALDVSLFGTFDDFASFDAAQQSMVYRESDEQLADFDVVLGHHSADRLRVGRHYDDLAMLLREPRARLVSLYTYWRSWSEPEHASWGSYDASRHAVRLPWAKFLHDVSIAPQIDNVAARLILGRHRLVPVDRFIAYADVEQVTTDALRAMERFGFVDIIENGDTARRGLENWADLSLVIGHRNETPAPPSDTEAWHGALDQDALDALDQLSVVDDRLWQAAAARSSGAPQELRVRADQIAAERFRAVGVTLPEDRRSSRTTRSWRRFRERWS